MFSNSWQKVATEMGETVECLDKNQGFLNSYFLYWKSMVQFISQQLFSLLEEHGTIYLRNQ